MYGLNNRPMFSSVLLLAICACAFADAHEPSKPEPGGPPPAAPSREQAFRERIDRAIEMIRASDPNRADALEALRQSDPNQFGRELREYFRSRRPVDLGPGFFDLDEIYARPEGQPGPGKPETREGGRHRPFGGPGLAEIEKEKEEFEKWLQANYPDMMKRLLEIRSQGPRAMDRRAMAELRPYIGLYFASRHNPRLAEILKQDIPLRNQRRQLVEAINNTNDAAEKARLTAQLRTVVEKRFDLLVQQKQLEYDMLMQWLN
ncbi:MAG TPA: hypothetical protein VLH60_06200, partial [Sedimentisphaerales bacterium]|nr:hypothetical protein [Sedimentisphaerales bacterium]